MGTSSSVIIIGGGVIGLSIGWRLAAAGKSVTLVERGTAGQGASWAAAGMLAAGLEAEPGETALLALGQRSQALWPGFVAEIEAVSGQDTGYRSEGTLAVALTRDDAVRLRALADFQQRQGVTVQWLDGRALREREPCLHPGAVGALYSENDHQVDNRLLGMALKTAFCRAGGILLEHTAASLDMTNGRVSGIMADNQRIAGSQIIIAAGAWTPDVPGLPPMASPPVRPIKGQMLALRMDAARPLLRHVVWGPKAYLVPRRDGRLIVGATVEERGFDGALTAGGIYGLLDAAWRTLPGIEELPIDEMWVGFRPGSRDDAPILGETAVPGLIMATGHHRNGILLTPVTADGIAALVLEGTAPDWLAPFSPARFATAPQALEALS